jgi:hypothetical protein
VARIETCKVLVVNVALEDVAPRQGAVLDYRACGCCVKPSGLTEHKCMFMQTLYTDSEDFDISMHKILDVNVYYAVVRTISGLIALTMEQILAEYCPSGLSWRHDVR